MEETYIGAERFNVAASGIYGDRSGTVVKALCYKSEGRCLYPR